MIFSDKYKEISNRNWGPYAVMSINKDYTPVLEFGWSKMAINNYTNQIWYELSINKFKDRSLSNIETHIDTDKVESISYVKQLTQTAILFRINSAYNRRCTNGKYRKKAYPHYFRAVNMLFLCLMRLSNKCLT